MGETLPQRRGADLGGVLGRERECEHRPVGEFRVADVEAHEDDGWPEREPRVSRDRREALRVQPAGHEGGHVGQRQPGQHEERDDRRGEHEEHRHEDQLRRHDLPGPGLEAEVPHNRKRDHEQRDLQPVDVGGDARGGEEDAGEQERDADDRLGGELTALYRLGVP